MTEKGKGREKEKSGKVILIIIIIVAAVMLMFLFGTMVGVTLLDPRSLDNITLQITIT